MYINKKYKCIFLFYFSGINFVSSKHITLLHLEIKLNLIPKFMFPPKPSSLSIQKPLLWLFTVHCSFLLIKRLLPWALRGEIFNAPYLTLCTLQNEFLYYTTTLGIAPGSTGAKSAYYWRCIKLELMTAVNKEIHFFI